jgi:hypothetical protein
MGGNLSSLGKFIKRRPASLQIGPNESRCVLESHPTDQEMELVRSGQCS